MLNNIISIEPLLKSIEAYSLSTIQLYKLYLVDFIANAFAELYSKLLLMALLLSCIFFFSVGVALWIGTITGKVYLGFLFVSGIYFFIAIIVARFKQYFIQDPIYNYTVRKLK